MTRQQITYVVMAVLAVVVVILIVTMIRISANRDSAIDKIKLLDQQMEAIARERNAYILLNEQKDKNIAESEKRDSMYLQAIINRQPKYIANDKKYNDIPKRINDLDHDALIREITNY